MTGENVTCVLDGEHIICNGTEYVKKEDPLNYTDEWFWIYLGIYVALVLIAGLVSGLTMGLLSLDMMSLNVLATGGKPNERKYAAKIIPIIKRHHLLLVTLLLTNAAAVESMPLFLDRISDPVTAIAVSVTAVLIFGEVVPQAICTRYGLAIGAHLSFLVKFLMLITLPISWPLSKLLDCVLGTEHGTFFRRAELSALVDLHQQNDHENEEPLSKDEAMIIKGALSMRDKNVKDVCTSLEKVYSLNIMGVMDEKTMEDILNSGHSRVPVYEGEKSNLLGILLVKKLIKLDPEESVPIQSIFQKEGRDLPTIRDDLQLYDLLNQFQNGRSHMCKVIDTSDNIGTTIGIITLEDVIEELIQEEILDETDLDVMKRLQVAKVQSARRKLLSSTHRSSTVSTSPRHLYTDGEDTGAISESDTQPLLS